MNDDGSFNLHGPKMEFPEEVSQGIHQLLSQWLQTSSFQILPDDTFTPSSNNSLSLTTDRQRMEPVIFFTTNTSPRTHPEKSPTVASVTTQVPKRSYVEATNNVQEIDNSTESQNSKIDTRSLVSPINQKPNQTPRPVPKATLHTGNFEESISQGSSERETETMAVDTADAVMGSMLKETLEPIWSALYNPIANSSSSPMVEDANSNNEQRRWRNPPMTF